MLDEGSKQKKKCKG